MSHSSVPVVTVVIPTYNYAHFISEAIESVLNQTYPLSSIEIIVIDDGSTDNTREVVHAFTKHVKYIYHPNSGKACATKTGIDNATGKYIFNLDADDIFLPDKIKEVVAVFEKDGQVTHVAHPAICWYMDEKKKDTELIPEWMLNRKIPGRDVLCYFYKHKMLFGGGSTFTARRDILVQYDIPAGVDMFIDEYLVLIALNQGLTYFLDEPLSVWRIHGRNYSNESTMRSSSKENSLRSMRSVESIRDTVLMGEFPQYLKMLYELKTKIDFLAMQEKYGEKSIKNVLSLWYFLFSNIRIVGKDIFSIIFSYALINRTIPVKLLNALKELKGR